jgi:hypothetical protein
MCWIWNAACITKVTCDGQAEQENKIPGTKKEYDNEGKDEFKAGNQDFDPDDRSSGHIHCGYRPTGSRRGRRPAVLVPTQVHRLPTTGSTT